MKRQIVTIASALVVLILWARPVFGQSLTTRSSTINYNYVYGAGGDTHVGGDNIVDTALLASDTEGTGFSGGTSGVIHGEPDHPYAGSVFVDLDHQYEIAGPLTSFQSITASASTHVAAAASGVGSALMNSNNPGNEILFNFTVAQPCAFQLSGNISIPGPSSASYVALQFFDGFAWQYLFYSAFLPGGQGAFDISGPLNPGQYRLQSALAVNAGSNEDLTGTYQYQFRVHQTGDMNCDGFVNGLDVQPFVIALQSPAAYAAAYSGCDILNGDMDGNSSVDVLDAPGFANRLLNSN